jgi:type II secretion system (T2SS) protein E
MTYTRQYATVPRGMHAPDERLYRTDKTESCAHCGAMTDWFDVHLGAAVCSADCHRALASRPRGLSSVQPLLGELLVRAALITQAELDEALRVQQRLDTYTPLGQVLLERKVITLKQLNAFLDKHRKRPKLGAVLVAAKVITTDQLEQAITTQRTRGVRLGDVLLRLGVATEQQIKQAICIQLNLPFLDLTAFRLEGKPNVARLIKRAYAERHRVVPIATLGHTVTVAMDDPTDVEVIRTVESGTGLVVNVVAATRAGLAHALAEVYRS